MIDNILFAVAERLTETFTDARIVTVSDRLVPTNTNGMPLVGVSIPNHGMHVGIYFYADGTIILGGKNGFVDFNLADPEYEIQLMKTILNNGARLNDNSTCPYCTFPCGGLCSFLAK